MDDTTVSCRCDHSKNKRNKLALARSCDVDVFVGARGACVASYISTAVQGFLFTEVEASNV